jgi:hypothetical protein
MDQSLNLLLTAFKPREVISFYLLISYLRKFSTNKSKLGAQIAEFGKEFLRNLNLFSIYDPRPPKGMSRELFEKYRTYKQESKILTTGDSLEARLEFVLKEFSRLSPVYLADPKRLHDAEQKSILFFRQKGNCYVCGKPMKFSETSSHHKIAHYKGGATDDLTNAFLFHEHCHRRLEKRLKKSTLAFDSF